MRRVGQGHYNFFSLLVKGEKIARAKNSCHDLLIMAKTVGSNFFLKERCLLATLDSPFAALSAVAGTASAATTNSAISKISKMVTPQGFEP